MWLSTRQWRIFNRKKPTQIFDFAISDVTLKERGTAVLYVTIAGDCAACIINKKNQERFPFPSPACTAILEHSWARFCTDDITFLDMTSAWDVSWINLSWTVIPAVSRPYLIRSVLNERFPLFAHPLDPIQYVGSLWICKADRLLHLYLRLEGGLDTLYESGQDNSSDTLVLEATKLTELASSLSIFRYSTAT